VKILAEEEEDIARVNQIVLMLVTNSEENVGMIVQVVFLILVTGASCY
jgi:hypothetical protein